VLTQLRLCNFKNFEDATLTIGPLTVIAGANASGKSNLRDAFRFLHGIGRGYSVAEIIGEKWSAGGVPIWSGIRGGTREVTTAGARSFALDVVTDFELPNRRSRVPPYLYHIEIAPVTENERASVLDESAILFNQDNPLFAQAKRGDRPGGDQIKLVFRRYREKGRYPPSGNYINSSPILQQIAVDPKRSKPVRDRCQGILDGFLACRFLDLSPTAMRMPSIPGQVVLGDRGDNLSSVLKGICDDDGKKSGLLDWVRQLTPMDAVDFDFPPDQTGRVLLTLVEADGRRTSAYSASDGTLRLLAILAALLGPEPARFYFLEELENGIHPNRLALLVQLLETTTAQGKTQVVATTHSPQLLRLLSRESLEHASVVYRLPGTSTGRIKRIVDIPHIREVLETQDLARLHESGWLEDILNFSEAPEPGEVAVEA
jgi:predicted ATPase